MIDLTRYSFSAQPSSAAFARTEGMTSRWMNCVRAVSTEGFGRLKYYREIRGRLDTDRQFSPYFEQESDELPEFYRSMVRKDLGTLWDWLPAGAMEPRSVQLLEVRAERHQIGPRSAQSCRAGLKAR